MFRVFTFWIYRYRHVYGVFVCLLCEWSKYNTIPEPYYIIILYFCMQAVIVNYYSSPVKSNDADIIDKCTWFLQRFKCEHAYNRIQFYL